MAKEQLHQPVLVCDPGLRERNEDYVDFMLPGDGRRQEDGALFVLADGMGGHQAGDVASRSAAQAIKRAYAASANGHAHSHAYGQPHSDPNSYGGNGAGADGAGGVSGTNGADMSTGMGTGMGTGNGNINERLARAITQANSEVYKLAAMRDNRSGMGTTAVAAVLKGNQLHVAHVGDSRAYVLHRATGHLEQITRDHSYVQELIDAGELDPEDAEIHPQRKVVTRCLGRHESVRVDTTEAVLEPGDMVLLCSDGLTRPVPDDFIAETLSEQPPAKAARILLDRANREGQDDPDNISMAIVQVPPPEVGALPPPLVIKPSGPRSAKRSGIYVGVVGLALLSLLALAVFPNPVRDMITGGGKHTQPLIPYTGPIDDSDPTPGPNVPPNASPGVVMRKPLTIKSPKRGQQVPPQDEPSIELAWEDPNGELPGDEVYLVYITPGEDCPPNTKAGSAPENCPRTFMSIERNAVADRNVLNKPGSYTWRVVRATANGKRLSEWSGYGGFTWSLMPTATPVPTNTPIPTPTPVRFLCSDPIDPPQKMTIDADGKRTQCASADAEWHFVGSGFLPNEDITFVSQRQMANGEWQNVHEPVKERVEPDGKTKTITVPRGRRVPGNYRMLIESVSLSQRQAIAPYRVSSP